LKIGSFVSELNAGKPRAVEVLTKLPHIIPHRKVNVPMVYILVLSCHYLKAPC